MFEELDTDEVDLNYRCRESLIPDPEGDEIRNLAKSKGFTAVCRSKLRLNSAKENEFFQFCSKIFRGEDMGDITLVSAEATTDIGDSSKDSAIISVERPKYHPDMSKPTTMTSVPSTCQDTDISNMSSLVSRSSSKRKTSFNKDRDSRQMSDEKPLLEMDAEIDEIEKTYMEKITDWLIFFKTFLESIIISATSSLNSVSRDYRFVAKRLSVEKKCLKRIIEIKESDGVEYDFISDQNWRKSTLAKLSGFTEDNLENIAKAESALVLKTWNELDKLPMELTG